MPHKVTVLTLDLQAGMFVSDLDRPWIETPFLMQGLLIENDSQIAILQQHCQSVTVDRSRSLGEAYARRDNGKDEPRQAGALPVFRQATDARPNDFANICRQLRHQPNIRRYRYALDISAHDQQSRLEPELLYSAPIIDDVKKSLKKIRGAIASTETISLNEVGNQVTEMARAVERNPDAMIWLARLRSADEYSYDHALDVSMHLMVFARFLGLPAKTMEQISIAGLLQDIGKVDIPAEILSKPGNLTDAEYQLIQSHVAASLEMLLGRAQFPTSVLEIIASHHERSDGSGYPRRLKGERIGFHGELAGLVDTYCAMTRTRAYDTAVSSQKALESLIQMRGTKFREPVVDQFIQCTGLYPIGSLLS